jgi:hypothetical protein
MKNEYNLYVNELKILYLERVPSFHLGDRSSSCVTNTVGSSQRSPVDQTKENLLSNVSVIDEKKKEERREILTRESKITENENLNQQKKETSPHLEVKKENTPYTGKTNDASLNTVLLQDMHDKRKREKIPRLSRLELGGKRAESEKVFEFISRFDSRLEMYEKTPDEKKWYLLENVDYDIARRIRQRGKENTYEEYLEILKEETIGIYWEELAMFELIEVRQR